MRRFVVSLILTTVFTVGSRADAAVTVTVEAPGIQFTTVRLLTIGIETFDGFTTGYKSTLTAPFGGGALKGKYTATFVNAASQYGGAGGTGKYDYVGTTSVLTITGGATDYFGLWASSLDGGNAVSFFKAGANIGTVRLVDYALTAAYRGNPTAIYAGRNTSEIYAFFNFFVPGGYDRVDLVQNGGGGFENDNQTIGTFAPGVPEPGTWAMLIAGFAMTGTALRRRRGGSARPSL